MAEVLFLMAIFILKHIHVPEPTVINSVWLHFDFKVALVGWVL